MGGPINIYRICTINHFMLFSFTSSQNLCHGSAIFEHIHLNQKILPEKSEYSAGHISLQKKKQYMWTQT